MNHPELLSNSLSHEQLDTQVILQHVVNAWKQLQTQQPLVQCITNIVAANYAANILLAAGASPAMVDNPFEAESFTTISGALSINVGTPHTEQMQAMRISAQTAQRTETPWVLDPVGYGAVLPWRTEMVNELLTYKPTVIRGNASEISTLAGDQNVESKGVDSTLKSADVYEHAKVLLEHCECVAISGESDYIISKEYNTVIQVNGGSHLQPKVTATGCALGALTAAYCAVTTPTIACIAAHVHFAIAGKLAFQKAQTVGSFNVAFLDQVYGLTAETIEQYGDVQVLT
ncbi:hydroxyethylthiazole kinase [Acinetobacter sp. 194]|uniref:hydroxyethylthiazole kinase n=1 Tax=Acinetobacter shaoyimingii TaxID=2715164 RepID=UPI0014089263|nr:hydroxyethylthiazole kinase [Acinetobacter shaoyimingii]NHB57306.1 hydroxyethylthiazole kinase [Acinetobacter shaoyimingii]